MSLLLKIKNLIIWDKIFLFFALISFSNPIIIFLLYKNGYSINYQSVNVYIVFSLLIFSISYILNSKRNSIFWYILSVFFIIYFLTFVGSFFPVFERRGFIELLGLYSSIAGAPLISVFLIKHFVRNGQIDLFVTLIFRAGVLIAILNSYFFYLLYFGDYTKIYLYTEFIGLGGYIKDLGTFFIRPAGYFFDYHSQYYIPMFSLVILISKKVAISKNLSRLVFLLCVVSILLSGIKSAYITGFALIIFYLIKKYSFFKFLSYSIILFIVTLIIDYYFDSVIFDLFYKIITHDINILIKHFFEVPQLLFKNYFHVLLFGGQVGMEAFIYSEVYYITLMYYIGFFGVLFLFIIPIIYTFLKGKTFYIQSITIIFSLSLVHYYVFKSSFNIFGTALFYFYFFTLYFKKNIIK